MNKGRREGQGERANNNKEFSYVFVWCLFRSLIGPKSGQNPKKKKHPNLQPHFPFLLLPPSFSPPPIHLILAPFFVLLPSLCLFFPLDPFFCDYLFLVVIISKAYHCEALRDKKKNTFSWLGFSFTSLLSSLLFLFFFLFLFLFLLLLFSLIHLLSHSKFYSLAGAYLFCYLIG